MALNDPQWGKKNNGGPPDLEEMMRNLNRKLSSLLGGGKGGDGGSSPGSSAGGIAILGLIIVVLWLASGFYIVDPDEQGIVLRFGKYQETTQNGPRWHMPYPIESVEVVNVTQVRTIEVGYRDNAKNKRPQESLMLTDDLNIIDIQFAVQYVLKDPADFLFNNRMVDDRFSFGDDQDKAQEIVRQAAETAIREVVGRNKMDFVLYEGREQVADDAKKLIQQILDRYKTGIQISQVTMQQAQPPEQVQAAFDDAVKAGQDRERQKNEGIAYANKVVPEAKGKAARLLLDAEGYKQAMIANAEGDASRFKQILAEYNKAPRVTRERLYLDMMQQILSSTTKVMVDQKNGSNLLYLPLDKLIQQTAPDSVAPTGTQAAAKDAEVQPSQPSMGDSRRRDYSLGRDRRER